MPDRIRRLPQDLANQIAAGEVIERPASVVKELVENSIDAESVHIIVKVEKGGAKLISVADDGIGMSAQDALTAFERHATSKIASPDDLFNIHTLGFRGEALSSIAAVARIRMKTRERGALSGTCVEVDGGKLINRMDTGCPSGTEIEVRELFYNVPARRNFMKGQATEIAHIIDIVTRCALAYREIHFVLVNVDKGNRPLLDLPPVNDLEERVFQIFGGDVAGELVELSFHREGYRLYGFLSRPTLAFKGRENQLFFVNRRPVRNPSLAHALQEAYRDLIPRERHPMAILFIDLDPALVDVNVHPAKREVKFKENNYVHDMVVEAVRESLGEKGDGHTIAYGISGERDRYYGLIKERGPDDFYLSLTHQRSIQDLCSTPQGRGDESSRIDSSLASDSMDKDMGVSRSWIEAGPSVKILGQIQALFIVAEIDGDLHIVDQHAAHERIIYDRLKRGYYNEGVEVQCLLIPETVDLSIDRAHILMDYIEPLGRLGFDIEAIGERSFMVRAIPALFAGEDVQRMITDTVDEILEVDLSPGKELRLLAIEDIITALLSRKACHRAVRAKELLSQGEMSTLVMDLLRTEMPYTCPHGRPVVRRFSLEELARMFGRK